MCSRTSPLVPIILALAACIGSWPAELRARQPDPSMLEGSAATDERVREQTADQQIRHVLNRLAFGPRPGDLERVRKLGVDDWIEWQLHPEKIDDRKVERLVSRFPLLSKSSFELARDYPPEGALAHQLMAGGRKLTAEDSMKIRNAGRESFRVAREMRAARVIRAVTSERQLLEVMTDFWLNHFNVHAGKERVRYSLPAYDSIIRAHALGNFRDLLGAVARSEAMLQYLDNFQSVADSSRATLRPRRPPRGRRQQQRQVRGLNENYARELLELHTMGADGGYTQ